MTNNQQPVYKFTLTVLVQNMLIHPRPPQVNLFFLLNIVRVLITKLKVTHQAESSLYMKAVRATLILVPLLGIQFVLIPYKPGGRVSSEIYDYIMSIFMHYQVRECSREGGRLQIKMFESSPCDISLSSPQYVSSSNSSPPF